VTYRFVNVRYVTPHLLGFEVIMSPQKLCLRYDSGFIRVGNLIRRQLVDGPDGIITPGNGFVDGDPFRSQKAVYWRIRVAFNWISVGSVSGVRAFVRISTPYTPVQVIGTGNAADANPIERYTDTPVNSFL